MGITSSSLSLSRLRRVSVGLAALLVLGLIAGCHSKRAMVADQLVAEGENQQRAQIYLDVALEAEAWIASTVQETEDGLAWPDYAEEPDVIGTSLYHGTPGIILFYLELHRSTGDPRFLGIALSGTRDLVARIQREMSEGEPSVAFHGGLSGVAFVLAEAGAAGGNEEFRELARQILYGVREHAISRESGISWIEPMPFSEIHGKKGMKEVLDMTHGATGIGLEFLYAAESGLLPEAEAWARAIGDRLLEVGTPVPGGMEWQMVLDMPLDFNTPNFSHGTSGISFFLARLYEVTGDERYLTGAIAGANRLKEIATVSDGSAGKGRLVYHHEGAGEDLFYLSWCHGPVGTGRLFHQLAKVTGDENWDIWLYGGLTGIQNTGAPESRSDGFWNNISQCCGDAGVGEFSLSLYTLSGDPDHLEYAERIGQHLDRQKTAQEHGVCWIQAEHRSRPKFLKAHTGYMQGAAGVGSYLLRLHAIMLDRPDPKIHWPDSPFG